MSWGGKNIVFFPHLKSTLAHLDCFLIVHVILWKQKGELWSSTTISFWTIMFETPTSQCHQWHSISWLCFISVFICLCHCLMRCGCPIGWLTSFGERAATYFKWSEKSELRHDVLVRSRPNCLRSRSRSSNLTCAARKTSWGSGSGNTLLSVPAFYLNTAKYTHTTTNWGHRNVWVGSHSSRS